ncbi:MAG: three-Cys-motif partner protein TcmP [Rickettsiales bacterium]
MPYKHYDWANSRSPPILQSHSLIKHAIIEDYIELYVRNFIATSSPNSLKITIIDGFSGGGVYRVNGSKKLYFGSPFIFLKIIQKIEKEIKNKTGKKYYIDVVYYFIDKSKDALDFLRKQLHKNGYGKLIGEHIFLLNGSFSNILSGLTEIIKHRNGRVLFLLDQYGYKDVPLHIIKNIFINFYNAEVLLTFAVGSLVNYITDTPQFYKCVSGVQEEKYSLLSKKDIILLTSLKEKISDKATWRLIAEHKILKRINKILGTLNCAPCFIVSNQSNRRYWLLHLSTQIKTRNKMMKLYSDKHNLFIHNKALGFSMFGFKPKIKSL